MKIEEMKRNLQEAGVLTAEDIEKVCQLETEYLQECESISEECAEEGYPTWGSNYELRCEQAREYYDQEIDNIFSKYPEYDEE